MQSHLVNGLAVVPYFFYIGLNYERNRSFLKIYISTHIFQDQFSRIIRISHWNDVKIKKRPRRQKNCRWPTTCWQKKVARTTKRLHHAYDHHLNSNTEDNNNAYCLLQPMSPFTILNWKTAYAEDKDTKLIKKCLLSHKTSCIPDLLVKIVSMGYRHDLKRINWFSWR